MKDKRLFYWLILGAALNSMAHLTFNIEILAWIASAPFLIYLGRTKGFLSRLWFVIALFVAWSIGVSKIISDPIPWFFIPAYSLPITLLQAPAYLIWAKWRDRKLSLYIFPSVMIISEWVQHSFTPLASWGSWSYTQVDNIILIQIISITGIAGLSFLIHWTNAFIAQTWINKKLSLKTIAPLLVVFALTLFYGSLRFDLYNSISTESIRLSAVGTDSEVSGLPIPLKAERDKTASALFSRTLEAAKTGSELIVWNEAALVVLPEEENELKDSLSQLALKGRTSIVAAYIVLISESPFRFANKYIFVNREGKISSTYHKHHPVPGEPAIKGKEPIKIVEVASSKITGAICYDYDFPSLASSIGNMGADIVALPSSDWRGIDPIHTKMAAFRAIEQGHSIVRSTRFGLSALINPVGEIDAMQSSFDDNDRILSGDLPSKGIKTIYSITGDIIVYLSVLYLLVFISIRLLKNHGLLKVNSPNISSRTNFNNNII